MRIKKMVRMTNVDFYCVANPESDAYVNPLYPTPPPRGGLNLPSPREGEGPRARGG